MRYTKEEVDRIRRDCRIVEVMDHAGVTFNKVKSKRAYGVCSFCDMPFLVVNVKENLYHCFACGKGGDPFTFLMDKYGIKFDDAVNSVRGDAPYHGLDEKMGCLMIIAMGGKYVDDGNWSFAARTLRDKIVKLREENELLRGILDATMKEERE